MTRADGRPPCLPPAGPHGHREHRRPRLFWRIFLALVGVSFATMLGVAGLGAWFYGRPDAPSVVERGIALLGEDLPPTGDPRLPPRLAEVGARLRADLTLREPDGETLTVGPELPPGPPGWFGDGGRHGVRVPLEAGRELRLAIGHDPFGGRSFLTALAAVMTVFTVASALTARQLARRLEALSAAMDRWAGGEHDHRAPQDGGDEIADVARTFNRAADTISGTLAAHRRTLASVSHELRSPLARLRMVIELLDDGDPAHAALREAAVTDIDELDANVGDLLQVGRLQAVGVERREPVDLAALVAELDPRAPISGTAPRCEGDPRLLRRLIRNLLENARRHGGGEVAVEFGPDGLDVVDRGPGVPPAEAERIFEPFYRPAGHAEGRDGGVGLGLWLVAEIARAHGGTVRCAPREGGGARFSVRLPTFAAG